MCIRDRSGRGPRTDGESYPNPVGGLTNQSSETPLSENFIFGPTGRSSNQLYDVRHARLRLHADFRRLPELFSAFAKVNLMTVIGVDIKSIDAYKLLEENYMYGAGDIVEVELLVETLWFREWAGRLMPEAVQIYVGLAEPPPTLIDGYAPTYQ